MTPEAKQRQPDQSIPIIPTKRALQRWTLVTAVSAALTIGGGYLWSQQGKNPSSQQCAELTTQARTLETTLFDSGTLGVEGTIFGFREIRVPDDPKLKELGKLKNDRDAACAVANNEDAVSIDGWVRRGTMFVGAITILGGLFTESIWSRRRKISSQNQQISTKKS